MISVVHSPVLGAPGRAGRRTLRSGNGARFQIRSPGPSGHSFDSARCGTRRVASISVRCTKLRGFGQPLLCKKTQRRHRLAVRRQHQGVARACGFLSEVANHGGFVCGENDLLHAGVIQRYEDPAGNPGAARTCVPHGLKETGCRILAPAFVPPLLPPRQSLAEVSWRSAARLRTANERRPSTRTPPTGVVVRPHASSLGEARRSWNVPSPQGGAEVRHCEVRYREPGWGLAYEEHGALPCASCTLDAS